VELITKESSLTAKVLEKFAQVRNAIHKASRMIYRTGDYVDWLLQILIAEKKANGKYLPFKTLVVSDPSSVDRIRS
jgi:hypothetical protein